MDYEKLMNDIQEMCKAEKGRKRFDQEETAIWHDAKKDLAEDILSLIMNAEGYNK